MRKRAHPAPSRRKFALKLKHERHTFTFPEIMGSKGLPLDRAYTMYKPH